MSQCRRELTPMFARSRMLVADLKMLLRFPNQQNTTHPSSSCTASAYYHLVPSSPTLPPYLLSYSPTLLLVLPFPWPPSSVLPTSKTSYIPKSSSSHPTPSLSPSLSPSPSIKANDHLTDPPLHQKQSEPLQVLKSKIPIIPTCNPPIPTRPASTHSRDDTSIIPHYK